MRKKTVWAALLALVLGASIVAYGRAQTANGTDCPGTIECPLTGSVICKDLCPLSGGAARPDCPGKVECPLTGDLVCRDRCPLGDRRTAASPAPGCCRRTG